MTAPERFWIDFRRAEVLAHRRASRPLAAEARVGRRRAPPPVSACWIRLSSTRNLAALRASTCYVAVEEASAMADKLTFSGMTWDILEEKYGIRLRDDMLFEHCPPVEPTPTLVEYLRRARRARLANERARAHRLVDPVLAELEMMYDGKIATIPEMYLEVKGVEGLSGNPDFVVSAGTTNKVVPIIAIVEAKKEDIDGGLPQCAAELYATYLLDKGVPRRLYGCVTIGTDWRFLSFDGEAKLVVLDREAYLINDLPRLLGIFRYIVDVSLAALEQCSALP